MFRAVALVGALLLMSCSSDTAKPAAGRSSDIPTTTATTAPPATVPLQPASSPSEAAAAFVNAWKAGNRLLASTVAAPAAVESVFGAGNPGAVQNRECNQPPADSPVLCIYKTDVGEVQLRVQRRPDGWIVDQAKVSAA
jgi:hypothetical protein